ncbi:mCG145451, partial [Mus musculus]
SPVISLKSICSHRSHPHSTSMAVYRHGKVVTFSNHPIWLPKLSSNKKAQTALVGCFIAYVSVFDCAQAPCSHGTVCVPKCNKWLHL